MDDLVRQAMAKWPNVPDCYGWLGLDARGHWYMRDDAAQAQGSFASGQPGAKGSRLQHEKLIAFIDRNYAADPRGQWYFQNGPQRVFVELEATPWVWRVSAQGQVQSHIGQSAEVAQAVVDELGWLYLDTHVGFGVVHTLDVGLVAEVLEEGRWPLVEVQRAELPARHAYVCSPHLSSRH
ncbi:MAG: DUF2946 family protein [Rhodoferax sp.]|nr:DUF2946 family protein [Rhodoferax sp.]